MTSTGEDAFHIRHLGGRQMDRPMPKEFCFSYMHLNATKAGNEGHEFNVLYTPEVNIKHFAWLHDLKLSLTSPPLPFLPQSKNKTEFHHLWNIYFTKMKVAIWMIARSLPHDCWQFHCSWH